MMQMHVHQETRMHLLGTRLRGLRLCDFGLLKLMWLSSLWLLGVCSSPAEAALRVGVGENSLLQRAGTLIEHEEVPQKSIAASLLQQHDGRVDEIDEEEASGGAAGGPISIVSKKIRGGSTQTEPEASDHAEAGSTTQEEAQEEGEAAAEDTASAFITEGSRESGGGNYGFDVASRVELGYADPKLVTPPSENPCKKRSEKPYVLKGKTFFVGKVQHSKWKDKTRAADEDESGATVCFGGGDDDQVAARFFLPCSTRQITIVYKSGAIAHGGTTPGVEQEIKLDKWASSNGNISPWIIAGKADKWGTTGDRYVMAPTRGSYKAVQKAWSKFGYRYKPPKTWAGRTDTYGPRRDPHVPRGFPMFARAKYGYNGNSIDFRPTLKWNEKHLWNKNTKATAHLYRKGRTNGFPKGDYSLIHGENYFAQDENDNNGVTCVQVFACRAGKLCVTTTPAPITHHKNKKHTPVSLATHGDRDNKKHVDHEVEGLPGHHEKKYELTQEREHDARGFTVCTVIVIVVPLFFFLCGCAGVYLARKDAAGRRMDSGVASSLDSSSTLGSMVPMDSVAVENNHVGAIGRLMNTTSAGNKAVGKHSSAPSSTAGVSSLDARRKNKKKQGVSNYSVEQENDSGSSRSGAPGGSSLDARRKQIKKDKKMLEQELSQEQDSSAREAGSLSANDKAKRANRKPKKKKVGTSGTSAPLLDPQRERAVTELVGTLGISKKYAQQLVGGHAAGERPDVLRPPPPHAKDKAALRKAGIDLEKEGGQEELHKLVANLSHERQRAGAGAPGGELQKTSSSPSGAAPQEGTITLDDVRKKGLYHLDVSDSETEGSDSETPGKKKRQGARKKKTAKKKVIGKKDGPAGAASAEKRGLTADSSAEKEDQDFAGLAAGSGRRQKKNKRAKDGGADGGLLTTDGDGSSSGGSDSEKSREVGRAKKATKHKKQPKKGAETVPAAGGRVLDATGASPEGHASGSESPLMKKEKKKMKKTGLQATGTELSPASGPSFGKPSAYTLSAPADRIATEKTLRKAGVEKGVAKHLAKAAADSGTKGGAPLTELQKKALRDARVGECENVGQLRNKMNKREQKKKQLQAERHLGSARAEQVEAERVLRKAGIGHAYARKVAQYIIDSRGPEDGAPPPPPPAVEIQKLEKLGFGPGESAERMRQGVAAAAEKQRRDAEKRLLARRALRDAARARPEKVDVREAAEKAMRAKSSLKTVTTIVPERTEMEQVLLRAGLGKSHARKLARRLGDPDVERIRLDNLTEVEAKALAGLGFGGKEASAEKLRGFMNAACTARRHKEKQGKKEKQKEPKKPAKQLEVVGDAQRTLMGAGIKEAEAERVAHIIADMNLAPVMTLPGASMDAETHKILDTLGFGAGAKAVDVRDWVAAQAASEKWVRTGTLEARTISENLTEKALLTAGLSRKTAEKLAQQCANADLDPEVALDTPQDANDMQLLQKMGLFGDTETVGNLRMFLHRKLEQKYGTDEFGNLNLEDGRGRGADNRGEKVTAGMGEQAFVLQGFSKQTATKLAEKVANGVELNTEELQDIGMNARDVEILTDLCGDFTDESQQPELAARLAGFVKQKKAEKEQRISLDLTAEAFRLPSLGFGNAEEILVARGFETRRAKKMAKAIVAGDGAGVDLEAGEGLTKEAKALLSQVGVAGSAEDEDGMLHLSGSALEQIKDMLADEIEDEAVLWRDDEPPTDEELLKDLGKDEPDEDTRSPKRNVRSKPAKVGSSSGESFCCSCCPCFFDKDGSGEDDGARRAAPGNKRGAPNEEEELQSLLKVGDTTGAAADTILQSSGANASDPSTGRSVEVIDMLASGRAALSPADALETMRGEAESALIAIGFSPAGAKTLSAKMAAAPALGATDEEVERQAAEVLTDEHKQIAADAGLTGVATISDLLEQLLEKHPQHFSLVNPTTTDADLRRLAPLLAACLASVLSALSLENLNSSGLFWLTSAEEVEGSTSRMAPAPSTMTKKAAKALQKEMQQKLRIGAIVSGAEEAQSSPRRLSLLEAIAVRRGITKRLGLGKAQWLPPSSVIEET